ncbi:MAG: hypothetical protein Kow0059_06940 [Candidatus Sumerlaeia bacterium]
MNDSSDHGGAPVSLNQNNGRWEIHITNSDRDRLRRLAGKVAEVATRPVMAERRARWTAHNSLKPVFPLLLCDPEGGWREIIPDNQLECESALARNWERRLRQEIYHADLGDDYVVEPRFDIKRVFRESDWGQTAVLLACGAGPGNQTQWNPPIKDWSELDRFRFPQLILDEQATQAQAALAHEVFDGILNVGVRGQWWWTLGLTNWLVYLRGHAQIMMDMIEAPEELHRLMELLRDGLLARLDWLEEHRLLSPNTDGVMVGSGGLGYSKELPLSGNNHALKTTDLWGFAEAQDLEGLRAEHFEEFIFPYQEAVLDRFGLNCYGCCEAVELRWSAICQLPRLRRVSVSPWSDRVAMAVCLDTDYIYSLKPNPIDLSVTPLNEDLIRRRLRDDLQAAHGCRLEIILRDTHTLGGGPQNLERWVQLAREEMDRIY